MKFPFEVSPDEIFQNPDPYIDATFASLESDFLSMPKGNGFISYPVFKDGYEALKKGADGFQRVASQAVFNLVMQRPIVLIVLRAILGLTPPEWAYLTSQRTGVKVSQGFVRTLDRKIRMAPELALTLRPQSARRVGALVETACQLSYEGATDANSEQIHRLDKVDTQSGLASIQHVASMGIPLCHVAL